ncbi:hypothetical protein EDD86DRAFT_212460 [Gorgonomyces haynaldii]|nr:hypothetical protein EDD86DRAFT_212460 [Gorgonomyces haynaldii]
MRVSWTANALTASPIEAIVAVTLAILWTPVSVCRATWRLWWRRWRTGWRQGTFPEAEHVRESKLSFLCKDVRVVSQYALSTGIDVFSKVNFLYRKRYGTAYDL